MNDAFEMMPLFSKPVYVSKLSIPQIVKDDVNSLEYYQPSTSLGEISKKTYILDKNPFKILKDDIIEHIKKYVHNILEVDNNIEFYITNSWVTLHREGDLAPLHIHSNSIISGTLYINIPDDDSSVFQLHASDTHRLFGLFQPPLKNYNFWNSSISRLKPETGTLILFPSDLAHSTTAMTSSTENRYCLAFNVFIKGDIGNPEDGDIGSINRVII